MKSDEFRDLVLDIYQTVADPGDWQKVFDQIAQRVDARGCILFEWRNYGNERKLEAPLITSNYARELVQTYIDKYANWESEDQDLFEQQSLTLDGIELANESGLFKDEEEYLAQPHVQEMLGYGIRHRYGCLLDKDNPYRARFAIQTGKTRGPLVGTDREVLASLLPHVAKAMDLCGPLGNSGIEHQALLSIIEGMPIGVCVLDSSGRVELTNTEFQRQQETHKAFWTDQHNHLKLHENADRQQYTRLLKDALNHGEYGARPRKEAVLINTADSAAALCLEIVPLRRSAALGTSLFNGALLFSRDTTRPIKIDVDLAQLAFGLTPIESEVTRLVCEGLTNIEIADRRSRSVETINAQVKTIFGKSSVANRTQLVRLLCNFSITNPAVAA